MRQTDTSEQSEVSEIKENKVEMSEETGKNKPESKVETADTVSESNPTSGDDTFATSDNSNGIAMVFMIVIALSALLVITFKKERN